jgi:hypothetical protein
MTGGGESFMPVKKHSHMPSDLQRFIQSEQSGPLVAHRRIAGPRQLAFRGLVILAPETGVNGVDTINDG